MSGALTLTEDILSSVSGKVARAGDFVTARPDLLMAHDGNRPLATDVIEQYGADRAVALDRLVLVIDHGVPAPNAIVANIHQRMRDFASTHGSRLIDAGSGISHVVLPERGIARPGQLILATDSHTTTMGALGCLATGVGATDLALAAYQGEIWLRVPQTIRIRLEGQPRHGVTPRDVMHHLLRSFGTRWATYKTLEFTGEYVRGLSMDGRFTLCNLAIEMGAKFGLCGVDAVTVDWLLARGLDPAEFSASPADATYERTVEIDVSTLGALVACPHSPARVKEVGDLAEVDVHVGFIGSCTNGRFSDLAEAAEALRGRQVAPGRVLYIAPGSREVYLRALREGLVEVFAQAGATILASGCGPCAGVQGGIPADDANVISTSPRNFRGRMGNPAASIYLASPAVVAASICAGHISSGVEP